MKKILLLIINLVNPVLCGDIRDINEPSKKILMQEDLIRGYKHLYNISNENFVKDVQDAYNRLTLECQKKKDGTLYVISLWVQKELIYNTHKLDHYHVIKMAVYLFDMHQTNNAALQGFYDWYYGLKFDALNIK